jgi:hypothetical protein
MGNFTTVPTRAATNVVTAAEWNAQIGQNLNLGVFRQLAETVLTGSAASIDFTSIPATFRHLLLVAYLRISTATPAVAAAMRFNNDTGANYDVGLHQLIGGTINTVESFAASYISLGTMPAATASANLFSAVHCLIPHYANTANNKSARGHNGSKVGTTTNSIYTEQISGFWRNNAAINQLTLLPLTDNFVAGCVATLYGLPA